MGSPHLSKTHIRFLISLLTIIISMVLTPVLLLSTVTDDAEIGRLSRYRATTHRQSRTRRSLVYWTPHKTGSTSMRLWLKTVAKQVGAPYRSGSYYPYMTHTDWHTRVSTLSKEQCNFIVGHIRIVPVEDRPHEGKLGAVITTTRGAMDTLASKHFQRTSNSLEKDIEQLLSESSEKSRRWFFYFNDLDPCEQLRYYDGEEGCEKNEDLLVQRARRIAERIDCVVDTDDPEEDVKALCEMMRLEKCQPFPNMNIKGHTMYKQLFANEHITPVMQRVVRVTEILRAELMKRRCRFLTDGSGYSALGLEEPKWPFEGCKHIS